MRKSCRRARPSFTVEFFSTPVRASRDFRTAVAQCLCRLVCPEAYGGASGHYRIGRTLQRDRIPEQAVDVINHDRKTDGEWVMGSWTRVEFFNKYLFGTIPPRIQLDFIPRLCLLVRHVVLKPKHDLSPTSISSMRASQCSACGLPLPLMACTSTTDGAGHLSLAMRGPNKLFSR